MDILKKNSKLDVIFRFVYLLCFSLILPHILTIVFFILFFLSFTEKFQKVRSMSGYYCYYLLYLLYITLGSDSA